MTTSPMVRDYLAALHSTASDRLQASRSDELVEEIREHIDAAIDHGLPVEVVLERLGSPAEIVAAEIVAAESSTPPPRPQQAPARLRAQEVLAMILVLVGAVALGVGWIVGVVLLWLSDRWTLRDKLIGTLLWPGGLAPVLVVGGFASSGTSSVEQCDSSGACTVTSTSAGTPTWIVVIVFVVLVVVPICTSVHLARSAKVPTTR